MCTFTLLVDVCNHICIPSTLQYLHVSVAIEALPNNENNVAKTVLECTPHQCPQSVEVYGIPNMPSTMSFHKGSIHTTTKQRCPVAGITEDWVNTLKLLIPKTLGLAIWFTIESVHSTEVNPLAL